MRGETPAGTLRRELKEETGLEVRPTKLLRVRTKGRRMTEFVLLAECAGKPEVKSVEIMDARFWDLKELPESLVAVHRRLLGELEGSGWSGMELEAEGENGKC